MARIDVTQIENSDVEEILALCPFGAIEHKNSKIEINAGCKMCRICVKQRPDMFELIEDVIEEVDKSMWSGIAVYVEHDEGKIHPVTFELIGKAREMAKKVGYFVYAVFVGSDISSEAEEILKYGVDELFIYDHSELKHFRIEPYTAAVENFIDNHHPSSFLFGGTTIGRSLAPRVAARFRTGLTADCTILEMQENTDMDQIRPAFGGNIMAHIHTPNHRPQFATVRYKIFDKPEVVENPTGKITKCELTDAHLASNITVLDVHKKEPIKGIEDAEIVIVAGRGIQKESDLDMIFKLADELGGEVASTRPLIEAGWTDPKRQIGLSGRTVKPKLIITIGVSGAIQFVAGMQNSDMIIAINSDKTAPILKVAHYGLVGDLYEIIPTLSTKIAKILGGKEAVNV